MAAKNKPAASKDKSKEKSGDSKKSKKDKVEGGAPKAEITIALTDEQASKVLKNAKVLTVQELARQTGVKISAANRYLKQAAQNGTVKKVGGHSGHYIYQTVS